MLRPSVNATATANAVIITRTASLLAHVVGVRDSVLYAASPDMLFSPLHRLRLLGLLLADLPAPRSEHLDHLGRDGGRQGDADEDEALVDGVCKRELCG